MPSHRAIGAALLYSGTRRTSDGRPTTDQDLRKKLITDVERIMKKPAT